MQKITSVDIQHKIDTMASKMANAYGLEPNFYIGYRELEMNIYKKMIEFYQDDFYIVRIKDILDLCIEEIIKKDNQLKFENAMQKEFDVFANDISKKGEVNK